MNQRLRSFTVLILLLGVLFSFSPLISASTKLIDQRLPMGSIVLEPNETARILINSGGLNCSFDCVSIGHQGENSYTLNLISHGGELNYGHNSALHSSHIQRLDGGDEIVNLGSSHKDIMNRGMMGRYEHSSETLQLYQFEVMLITNYSEHAMGIYWYNNELDHLRPQYIKDRGGIFYFPSATKFDIPAFQEIKVHPGEKVKIKPSSGMYSNSSYSLRPINGIHDSSIGSTQSFVSGSENSTFDIHFSLRQTSRLTPTSSFYPDVNNTVVPFVNKTDNYKSNNRYNFGWFDFLGKATYWYSYPTNFTTNRSIVHLYLENTGSDTIAFVAPFDSVIYEDASEVDLSYDTFKVEPSEYIEFKPTQEGLNRFNYSLVTTMITENDNLYLNPELNPNDSRNSMKLSISETFDYFMGHFMVDDSRYIGQDLVRFFASPYFNSSKHPIYFVVPKDTVEVNIVPSFLAKAFLQSELTFTGSYLSLSKDRRSLISDPIDTASGAFTATEEILGVKLSYYSQLSNNAGLLGHGWEHDYELRLDDTKSGLIDVHWSANRKDTFKVSDNDPNKYIGVTSGVKNDYIINNRTGFRNYTLHRSNGERYDFYQNYGPLVGNRVFPTRHTTKTGQVKNLRASHSGVTITDEATGYMVYITRTEIGDSLGRRVRLGVYGDSSNRALSMIMYPNNDYKYFEYDENKNITSSHDGKGNVFYVNTYDEEGRVISQENNGLTTFDYTIDKENGYHIAEVTDREGNNKVLYHDLATMRLVKIEDEKGNVINKKYDEDGNLLFEEDQNGNITSFTHDGRDNLTSITNPKGVVTYFEYDSNDNVVKVDEAGRVSTFTYNDTNLITSETNPQGEKTSYTYTVNNLLETVTNPDGGVTNYTYTNGRVSSITDPSGIVTYYTHDNAGRLIELKDSKGNTTKFAYDQMNNLLRLTDADGKITTYTYDKFNRKISETDPKGNKTTYTYDINHNLLSETNQLGFTINYEYDREDRLVKTIDAKGNETQYVYDEKGQIIRVIDPLGNSISTEYDKVGNIMSMLDVFGRKVETTEYDSMNLPLEVSNGTGDSSLFEYNNWSEVTKTLDALGNKKLYDYTSNGKVSKVTDALNGVGEQSYTETGLTRSFTDVAGNTTTFTYDLAGRITSTTLESGHKVTHEYDDRGNLSKTTNSRGQNISYTYNNLNQVIEIDRPEGKTKLVYDVNGNILSSEDGSGKVSYVYDKLDRITKFTDVHNNTISYEYDENSNLVTLTYPDNKKVTYTYNAKNQLIGVKDWNNKLTTYQYDKNSRLVRTNNSNGTYEERDYDVNGRLTDLSIYASDGEIISSDTFDYDKVGNISSESGKMYTYDQLNRLVDATLSTNSKFNYVYDAQGNITDVTTSDVSLDMTYGKNNWLESVNGQSISYDEDGNALQTLINNQLVDLHYDSQNRLIESGGVEYVYDVNNTRVSMVESGETTNFVVNPLSYYSQLLMETTASGDPIKYYVYGLGLVGEYNSEESYSQYHYDYRGSTIALTNEEGEVISEFSYLPFGELDSITGEYQPRFLYNGQYGVETDSTGLYYMRARYYNPDIKRFINQDVLLGSIADSTSLNRYSYVNGNPILWIDPFGLEAEAVGFWGGVQGSLRSMTKALEGQIQPRVRNIHNTVDYYKRAIIYQEALQGNVYVLEKFSFKPIHNTGLSGGALFGGGGIGVSLTEENLYFDYEGGFGYAGGSASTSADFLIGGKDFDYNGEHTFIDAQGGALVLGRGGVVFDQNRNMAYVVGVGLGVGMKVNTSGIPDMLLVDSPVNLNVTNSSELKAINWGGR